MDDVDRDLEGPADPGFARAGWSEGESMITVTLQYFEDCPNWPTARKRLEEAIWRVGRDLFVVELHPLGGQGQDGPDSFGGAPTFHINGRDLFAGPDATFGWTCRLYPTPDGLAGAPTVEQLVHVLEWALID